MERVDKETQRDIAAVERTLSIIGDKSNEPADRITAANIAHCKTQRAALYHIAKPNGGIVSATKAGDLIITAGLTDAKRAGVIATIHRFMSYSDDWELTESGSFRLKTFAPHET